MSERITRKTFSLPISISLAIEAIAKKEGRSTSNMVAIILRQAINNYK